MWTLLKIHLLISIHKLTCWNPSFIIKCLSWLKKNFLNQTTLIWNQAVIYHLLTTHQITALEPQHRKVLICSRIHRLNLLNLSCPNSRFHIFQTMRMMITDHNLYSWMKKRRFNANNHRSSHRLLKIHFIPRLWQMRLKRRNKWWKRDDTPLMLRKGQRSTQEVGLRRKYLLKGNKWWNQNLRRNERKVLLSQRRRRWWTDSLKEKRLK